MDKFIIGAAGFGVMGLGLLGLHAGMVLPDDRTDLYKASVQIGDYCSGTVIDDPRPEDGIQFTVITAKHCLLSGQEVGSKVIVNVPQDVGNVFSTMEAIDTLVVDVSNESDLILLQGTDAVKGLEIDPIDIYGGTPQFGEEVISVSYPFAYSKLVVDGYLGYVVQEAEFGAMSESLLFQLTTVQVSGGSSGSGLFKKTDEGYALIGVLTGGMGHISMYTPTDEIRAFLTETENVNV